MGVYGAGLYGSGLYGIGGLTVVLTKNGYFGYAGGGKNGASVDAWLASRFISMPGEDSSPPSGTPDAGPVITSTNYGGPGAYSLNMPTFADYFVRVLYGGHAYWSPCPAATLQGDAGAFVGPSGPQGPPGPSGPDGPTGPAGATGPSGPLSATSASLPEFPVTGQQIFETDTNDVVIWNATTWIPMLDLAAWHTYVPSMATTGTQPSLGNGQLTGAYQKMGHTIHWRLKFVPGTTTSAGTGFYVFSLPFGPAVDGSGVGRVIFNDNSNPQWEGLAFWNVGGGGLQPYVHCVPSGGGVIFSQNLIDFQAGLVSNGRILQMWGTYEATS